MENQIFPRNETIKNLWSGYGLMLTAIAAGSFGLVDDFGVNAHPTINRLYCRRMVNAYR